MKTNESKDLTLMTIIDQFPTDEAAREHLEGIRWQHGIFCPHCKCKDQTKFSTIAANPAKKVRGPALVRQLRKAVYRHHRNHFRG